jgi:N-acetylglucosaminyldiphosphoundecaprenol N-acetyl-beta-D-mannosaminyltransferase
MARMTQTMPVDSFRLLGMPIARVTMTEAIEQVNGWVEEGTPGRIVTFANVHMVVESRQDPAVHEAVSGADMNCPDGSPLYWMARHLYGDKVTQVSGPDFMPLFCAQSRDRGFRHFLYGAGPGVAEKAARRLETLYPGITIAGVYTPPYRALSAEEDEAICRRIDESGADLVWVCLGCPKQEKWMYAHRDRLNAKVLLGVGQAIDILGGARERAPRWIRRAGLEWMYRLVREPRRLWKRYLTTNLLFVFWTMRESIFGESGVGGSGR